MESISASCKYNENENYFKNEKSIEADKLIKFTKKGMAGK